MIRIGYGGYVTNKMRQLTGLDAKGLRVTSRWTVDLLTHHYPGNEELLRKERFRHA